MDKYMQDKRHTKFHCSCNGMPTPGKACKYISGDGRCVEAGSIICDFLKQERSETMTKAGERILCRETIATHKETGKTVTITNAYIPIGQRQPHHQEQRNDALNLLSGLAGRTVDRTECCFEYKIVEIKEA
jgi:hypothetical protein